MTDFYSESQAYNFVSRSINYSFRTKPEGDSQIDDIPILDEDGYLLYSEDGHRIYQ